MDLIWILALIWITGTLGYWLKFVPRTELWNGIKWPCLAIKEGWNSIILGKQVYRLLGPDYKIYVNCKLMIKQNLPRR